MADLDDFFAKKDKRKKGKGKKFTTSNSIAKTLEVTSRVATKRGLTKAAGVNLMILRGGHVHTVCRNVYERDQRF